MKRHGKKIVVFLLVNIVLLCIIVVFVAATAKSKQIIAPPITIDIAQKDVVERLAKAIQFRTISYQEKAKIDYDEFLRYHQFLEKSFPLVQEKLSQEVINKYSLLFKWQGSDESLLPILMMAHMDVVSIEQEKFWQQQPFGGIIKDGFVWGRGAIDHKGMLMAILEAVTLLLKKQYTPQRAIYIFFGHDEELGGQDGARIAAQTLKERGIKFQYIFDEGGTVVRDIVPGISSDAAFVATSEKGYSSLELKVDHQGGHSSVPESENAIGILCLAVTRLEQNPFPIRLCPPTKQMFQFLAPEMHFSQRLFTANLWLFSPLITSSMAGKAEGNASIRTTLVPTIIQSGHKENVVPREAKVTINLRILSGETVAQTVDYVTNVINDERVQIKILSADPPVAASDANSETFRIIQKSVSQAFPNCITSPCLLVAQTDSRHFYSLTNNIYRFTPVILKREDMGRVHGVNERLGIDVYLQSIKFFHCLIKNSSEQ